jgi:hypothetical protein
VSQVRTIFFNIAVRPIKNLLEYRLLSVESETQVPRLRSAADICRISSRGRRSGHADGGRQSLFGAELAFSFTELEYRLKRSSLYGFWNQGLSGLRLANLHVQSAERISGIRERHAAEEITLTPRNCATYSIHLGTKTNRRFGCGEQSAPA